ncbi:MAG TPA: 5-(carboxyamino)imidazole ribonucleotide synthase [Alphaproteobacteria bacterium]|nr:5-(carboxyamino)imidazole ribonucleotide synthase [Alphaproteobacteria bacterium]
MPIDARPETVPEIVPETKMIGVLGGGQLGRMTIEAASALGYRCHVFAPSGDAPATDIASLSTRADYHDTEALAGFAKSVSAVVCEFENVPVTAMDILAEHVPVCPGSKALGIAQHRLSEKNMAQSIGIATPRYIAINNQADLTHAMTDFDAAILKTCRMGYDGKGQMRLTADNLADDSFAQMGSDDLILEELVDFTAEASFLVARDQHGQMTTWPASINQHRGGILHISEAPAPADILPPECERQGIAAVKAIAEELDLTGVLAVEMFITTSGQLLFNEIAPRPHNSFHWTIEGAETSQFSQLVRIAAGLPLGSTAAYNRWRMTNILGQDMPELDAAFARPGVHIHRYGKAEARTGRKMAHLNEQID